ncbi:hypothetical protein [Clostridium sp.]|uniref:hypothetical protein n=1 Tax=Clostridium sp. TaxID=1506 RepID=UPI003464A578
MFKIYYGSNIEIKVPQLIKESKFHKDFENIDAVADELIRDYSIVNGTFDNVKECEEEGYRVPSFWDIGKVYMRLIMPLCDNEFNSDKLDVLI